MSFYDRTDNITGVNVSVLDYSPEYGSTVSFQGNANILAYGDKLLSASPNGLNSISCQFNLNYKLRENDAQKLIKFYENQSGTGIFGLSDGSNIYKTLSGTISNVGGIDSANNDYYNISLSFDVEREAPQLAWSGNSFVNIEFKKWTTGQSFSKYDVCWFENDLEEPSNNWFYCLEDHGSVLANHPLSTGQKWTKNLFASSNDKFSLSQTPTIKKVDLKNSFVQRVNDQKNVHSFDGIEVSYKNVTDSQAKALLHFAESKCGYKRFDYQIPQIYNQPKTFICPKWSHQWNYKDSNNVAISLVEDSLGMVGEGKSTISIIQNSGISTFNASIGGDQVFYSTGASKELITGNSISLSWPSTGVKHSVKLFGRISNFSGVGQSILSANFGQAANLTDLNLSGNQLGYLNLYTAPNLQIIEASSNAIDGFDFYGKNNLRIAKINSNSSAYLNIQGCENLTGLHATGNLFPSVYVDSCLSYLNQYSKISGEANLTGSFRTVDSADSFSSLTGKGWSVSTSYVQPSITTTTTTTSAPSSPTNYLITADYAEDGHSACYFGVSKTITGNGASLQASTKISVPDELGSNLFFSDGVDYFAYQKVCCGKAVFFYEGQCSLVTTTEEPTTSTTTSEEPSTTTEEPTTEDPCIYGCMDPEAKNYDPNATCYDGSCTYP